MVNSLTGRKINDPTMSLSNHSQLCNILCNFLDGFHLPTYMKQIKLKHTAINEYGSSLKRSSTKFIVLPAPPGTLSQQNLACQHHCSYQLPVIHQEAYTYQKTQNPE